MHPPLPKWVKRFTSAMSELCLLFTRQRLNRRLSRHFGFGPTKRPLLFLFDHLVGDGEQRRRHVEAECLGGLKIEHELKFGGLNHRKIGQLGALEDCADIDTGWRLASSRLVP